MSKAVDAAADDSLRIRYAGPSNQAAPCPVSFDPIFRPSFCLSSATAYFPASSGLRSLQIEMHRVRATHGSTALAVSAMGLRASPPRPPSASCANAALIVSESTNMLVNLPLIQLSRTYHSRISCEDGCHAEDP